jgi:predicted P-loop ATPase
LKALIYTSPSHSPEKPRWRILAPLSRPLPAALRSKLMARLNGVFGGVFSGETWTLSQAYYFGSVDNNPAHRCEYYGGDYIDFRDDLDAGALGKAEGKATGKAIGFEGHLALLGDGPGLKGFHVPLRDGIASFVATHPADFDREGLKKRLREHIDRAPKDKERPYLKTDKHIDALIDSAVKRYGQAKRTGGLPWREQRKNGMPLPSMHNARLAITAIGVACSYNTFHNKLLFGFEGEAQHEIQFLVGEVTDNGIIALRQILSDRFGFDLGDQATRDAVVSLALEHCFDPVCDMLDKAQAEWDGKSRLDGMAVEYFNGADTKLNRAIIRKTIIAACRRARNPGCKFDNITVLESPEGWNKSSAWRVLAGDENFSDASILGHGAREVQEQLAEVWIHENADLAGMKKAEVETVKTFASRQSDDARPAYGHFLKKQKRHSIEVGTTNNDMYLQSQTGNRRFWPLLILKTIDLNLLKRDRLQLWGEAAQYEADGESITLDKKLWPAAAAEQEKRRVRDAWEDILADLPTHYSRDNYERITLLHAEADKDVPLHTKIVHRDVDRDLVASTDLLTIVLGIPVGQQHSGHAMRLANAMVRAGWTRPLSDRVRINGKQVRGYFRMLAETTSPRRLASSSRRPLKVKKP